MLMPESRLPSGGRDMRFVSSPAAAVHETSRGVRTLAAARAFTFSAEAAICPFGPSGPQELPQHIGQNPAVPERDELLGRIDPGEQLGRCCADHVRVVRRFGQGQAA